MAHPHKAYKRSSAHSTTTHHCIPHRDREKTRTTRLRVYSTLSIVAIVLSAVRLFPHSEPTQPITPASHSSPGIVVETQKLTIDPRQSTEIIPGGLRMQADASGHFRGTLYINQVAMPFMIDTGATNTTLPVNMANSAQLPTGHRIETSTAGGKIYGEITVAQSLRLGNAELKNLPVVTNPYLDEVLVGMNTLRHFKMTQTGTQLTLVTLSNPDQPTAALEEQLPFMPALNQPEPSSQEKPSPTPHPTTITQWKKSTVCDNEQNCRTVYAR